MYAYTCLWVGICVYGVYTCICMQLYSKRPDGMLGGLPYHSPSYFIEAEVGNQQAPDILLVLSPTVLDFKMLMFTPNFLRWF